MSHSSMSEGLVYSTSCNIRVGTCKAQCRTQKNEIARMKHQSHVSHIFFTGQMVQIRKVQCRPKFVRMLVLNCKSDSLFHHCSGSSSCTGKLYTSTNIYREISNENVDIHWLGMNLSRNFKYSIWAWIHIWSVLWYLSVFEPNLARYWLPVSSLLIKKNHSRYLFCVNRITRKIGLNYTFPVSSVDCAMIISIHMQTYEMETAKIERIKVM